MGDGTTFEIDIPVNAPGVESAATAVARLADQLTASKSAAMEAANAVKAGEAAYNQAEVSALRAATSLERIGLAADAQRGKLQAAMDVGDTSAADRAAAKLQNLVERQAEAASKSEAAKAAMDAEAASLDALKSAASSAAETEAQLSKAAEEASEAQKMAAKSGDDVASSAEGGSINMRMLSSAFGKLGGPLGMAGQQAAGFAGAIQKMGKSLGAFGPAVAAAVVTVALAAAFVLATAAVAKFAIASADTARTSALLSAGIARSVEGGLQLDATIGKLGSTVPLTKDELTSMASELANTGLRGDALSSALETAAVKAAKLKFGPDFAKQMLSLDFQSQKLKASVTAIFSGLKIEPLLQGLSSIVALFDKDSSSAIAMKTVFESLFQPIIDGLVALIPKAVATFIQFEIMAMKAMIAIKPFGTQIAFVGEALAVLAAIVVGVVVVAVALFVGLAALLVVGLVAVTYGAQKLGEAFGELVTYVKDGAASAFDWLVGKVQEVIAFLSGLSLSDVGTNMVQGLVDGITGAAGAVLSAMTGVVGGAVDAAKKALGIASPSKVFAEIGMNTGAGMAKGVDKSADDVQGSMESMVAAPDAGAGGAGAGGSGSSGGPVFHIVVNSSGGDGDSIAAKVRAVISDLLTQAGGAHAA